MNPSVKISAAAASVALVALCAPIPAVGQFVPPPLIIVPPPAQDYALPKMTPKRAPDLPKPSDVKTPEVRKGRYQGRTYLPDG